MLNTELANTIVSLRPDKGSSPRYTAPEASTVTIALLIRSLIK